MNNKARGASCTDFLVDKSDFRLQKFVHSDAPNELRQGQVRLIVDKFALTANNVTYAAFGDAMHYWDFFPGPDDKSGRVPVWGFADVADSLCSELKPGERIYGFLPMSTELIVTPVSVSRSGFIDGSAHRQNLHLVYNQYSRVGQRQHHGARTEHVYGHDHSERSSGCGLTADDYGDADGDPGSDPGA